ncbi:MAG: hypothetical protein M3153_10215 [Chloroflexota bacterium]|nr:hypothetical protein [Chloroflexota bacterium]
MRAGATGIGISVVLLGCGVIPPPDAGVPIEGVETTGRDLPGSLADNPNGPHVELMTGDVAGEEVEVAMQRDGDGACLAVRRPPDSSTGCGELPGEHGPFGVVMTGSAPEPDGGNETPVMAAGLVVAEVASVVAVLEDGREARAVLFPLAPARVEGSGFVVYVPATAPVGSAIVARGADGAELGRLEYDGPP